MEKGTLLGLANAAANWKQGSDISRLRRDSAAAKKETAATRKDIAAAREDSAAIQAEIERLRVRMKEKEAREEEARQEREAKEELERQRADLELRRQKEIKDTIFELKEELDDLEEEEDRVACVVILCLLQSEIEDLDLSLNEFESLPDREYARDALNRLEDLGTETEEALTEAEREQLGALEAAFELAGEEAKHVQEIEVEIESLEARLAEVAEKVAQQEKDLAERAGGVKRKRNKGIVRIILGGVVFYGCQLLEWPTVAIWGGGLFAGIGCLHLLGWILSAIGRAVDRPNELESLEKERVERDEIQASIQEQRGRHSAALKGHERAEEKLRAILQSHPELEFLTSED